MKYLILLNGEKIRTLMTGFLLKKISDVCEFSYLALLTKVASVKFNSDIACEDISYNMGKVQKAKYSVIKKN